MSTLTLTPELAKQFAKSTLGHVGREYPNGLGLVLTGPAEITPSGLHPIFYGSFDWHSCVHGWWQLFRLARLYPELAPDIYARAETVFTPHHAKGELEYIEENPGFERPYGWGWLLALHGEIAHHNALWDQALQPLAGLISSRLTHYLPRLTYPVRAGTHANTAFALILAYEWATKHDPNLKIGITEWARSRFGKDIAAPNIEPSGEDFLSPTLTEALLMARVLPTDEFQTWATQFMPQAPQILLNPVEVSDRSDGRIGHLDGLNLSRAWCWRNLANKIPSIRDTANQAAETHFLAALPHVEANYMSEHWLCSFALLALTDC